MRKTKILGFSMETRTARRRFVVAVYSVLAILLAAGWFLDRLSTTGSYVYFAAFFISYFGLGGYGPYGLIKPFNNKAPRNQPIPTSLTELRLASMGALDFGDSADYRNDERELQLRDRVHYRAYQAIFVLLAVIWLAAMWQVKSPHLISRALLAQILSLLAAAVITLALTLPQAILLWTEPNFDPDPGP